LYARVSSDAQQKEGTIESQVVDLKRQIAAAGHVLVREYIDDGITGTVLDRPALEQLYLDSAGRRKMACRCRGKRFSSGA
jgi:site-specific DNA recombinase